VPFANKPIPDPVFNVPNSTFLHDSNHAFVGLAGESRNNDANTPLFHVQQGAGPFSVVQTSQDLGKLVSFGGMDFKPEGTMPAKPDHRPVFRPGTPCEQQQVADLEAPRGPAETLADPHPQPTAADQVRDAAAKADLDKLMSGLKSGNGASGLTSEVDQNLSQVAMQRADSVLKVPMQAAAVQQYGNKAQVPALFKKRYLP
jgi:hypothetical protein